MKKSVHKTDGIYSNLKRPSKIEISKTFSTAKGIYSISSSIHQLSTLKYTPPALTFALKDIQRAPAPKEVSGLDMDPRGLFALRSFDPKVQVPYYTSHGTLSRFLAIERLKKKFKKQNLKKLLLALGINYSIIHPDQIMLNDKTVRQLKRHRPEKTPMHIIPLEYFDDSNFEVMNPEEWMMHGLIRKKACPIPAFAFLPITDEPESPFEWEEVAVVNYDDEMDKYLVDRLITVNNKLRLAKNGFFLPRIYIMFAAEDPRVFAQRIKAAVKGRLEAEEKLKLTLYIDCMPTEGLCTLPPSSIERILDLSLKAPSFKGFEIEQYIPNFTSELQANFQRALNYSTYEHFAEKVPRQVISSKKHMDKQIIRRALFSVIKQSGYKTEEEYCYRDQRSGFTCQTFLTTKQVIQAQIAARAEISLVQDMKLFQVPIKSPMRLDDFQKIQNDVIKKVHFYVQESWLKKIKTVIHSKLLGIGKGWYNIYEKNYFAYKMSKMKKFMNVVNYMMQDTLRYILLENLEKYTTMIVNASEPVMEVPIYNPDSPKSVRFVWKEDYKSRKYWSPTNALFYLEILVVGKEIKFLVEPEKVAAGVVEIFNNGLKSTQKLPQIEKYVMEDMLFGDGRVVESVGEHEPEVEEWRNQISDGLNKSLIAINAYIKKFDEIMEYGDVDPSSFIKEYAKQGFLPPQMAEDIKYHKTQKDNVEKWIPESTIIGPFFINVKPAKLSIMKKHQTLATALLEHLTSYLRVIMEKISADFNNLKERVTYPCGNIEDFLEHQVWLESVPKTILEYRDRIILSSDDYKLISSFSYQISPEDFDLYWTNVAWPKNANAVLENVIANFEETKRSLHKLLLQDQGELSDRLERIDEMLSALSTQTNLKIALEVAVEIHRIDKNIKDCQALGALYNKREKLFGTPEEQITDYSKIDRLADSFAPYYTLWLSYADFLKWKDRIETDNLGMEREEVDLIIYNLYMDISSTYENFLKDYPDIALAVIKAKEKIVTFVKASVREEDVAKVVERLVTDTEAVADVVETIVAKIIEMEEKEKQIIRDIVDDIIIVREIAEGIINMEENVEDILTQVVDIIYKEIAEGKLKREISAIVEDILTKTEEYNAILELKDNTSIKVEEDEIQAAEQKADDDNSQKADGDDSQKAAD